ncbi:MAG: inorganic phosphate transporter [Planctomycetia bacterium]|nr:inorganic phosphate transporter [Planctomycetia bacterium]
MSFGFILLAVLCLAFANGGNDNFKGVATLFGSGTTNYRRALAWATVTTLGGSTAAVFLAERLLKNFSGRGLVDDTLVADSAYVAAVALAAGLTVLVATRIGMPISTTHGLMGALVGAGWAAGSSIDGQKLVTDFFLPLVASPVIAIVATVVCYRALHRLRAALGVTAETCFCIGSEVLETCPLLSPMAATEQVERLSLRVGSPVTCQNHYHGRLLGLEAGWFLDRLHFLSAGVVSFARGLNDTPKIAAILLLAPQLSGFGSTMLVGLVMAAGGLASARRVAELMSQKITPMNHGQGLTANLVTGLVVLSASRFGWPVSTTHVSCGAIFGLGAVTGGPRWKTIAVILLAWLTTLPAAIALGAACFWAINRG